MRLTSELITDARAYYNPLRQREIDLRGLKIPVMENLGSIDNQFDVVDLSDNSISVIENIPKFHRLKSLLLSNNLISKIAKNLGANVPACEHLILTNNRIGSFKELANLKDWKNLSFLSLVDNPIASEPNFRIRVISILPQITCLNYSKVTMKERQEAAKLVESE